MFGNVLNLNLYPTGLMKILMRKVIKLVFFFFFFSSHTHTPQAHQLDATKHYLRLKFLIDSQVQFYIPKPEEDVYDLVSGSNTVPACAQMLRCFLRPPAELLNPIPNCFELRVAFSHAQGSSHPFILGLTNILPTHSVPYIA